MFLEFKDFKNEYSLFHCRIDQYNIPLFSLEICFFFPLQPCTEVLFIDIFHEYNQTLTPVLLEMMQTLQGEVYFMILY